MELVLDLSKRYTYADYLTWMDDTRRELIDGSIRLTSPSPNVVHQSIIRNFIWDSVTFFKKNKNKYRIYPAPVDVKLYDNDEICTVVQPDLVVITDLSQKAGRIIEGVPHMVVEILSPSTNKYDLTEKYSLYEKHGVKEYWIVYPLMGATVFVLQDNGMYDEGTHYEEGMVRSFTIEGLALNLKDLFED